jgi:hypothetical protein
MTKNLEEATERSRKEMKHAIVVMTVTFAVVILIGAIYWIAHRSWF